MARQYPHIKPPQAVPTRSKGEASQEKDLQSITIHHLPCFLVIHSSLSPSLNGGTLLPKHRTIKRQEQYIDSSVFFPHWICFSPLSIEVPDSTDLN